MGFDNPLSAESKPLVRRDPQIVRQRILDAAQHEFMRVGYERANTNLIAQRFGVSKATIFRYFPTKRDLFEAVVERIAERWRQGIAIDTIAADTPREWLTLFAEAALHWILQDEALFVGRIAISEGPFHDEVRNLWPKLAALPVQRTLADRFLSWQDAGLVRAGAPENFATAFLDLTISGEVSRALYGHGPKPSPEAITRHASICVDIFLNGCSAGSAAPSSR